MRTKDLLNQTSNVHSELYKALVILEWKIRKLLVAGSANYFLNYFLLSAKAFYSKTYNNDCMKYIFN